MSKEFINGSEPDANKQWAGLFYDNLDTRAGLIKKLQISFLADGSISFNRNETYKLINFIATEAEGVEWEPETTEEEKLQIVDEVMCHFFDMLIEGNSYLARFSAN